MLEQRIVIGDVISSMSSYFGEADQVMKRFCPLIISCGFRCSS